MTVIAVTGTPCTGKTTLATDLAKELGYEYVAVSQVIAENKLNEEYDEERQCAIVDEEKLVEVLIAGIKPGRNYIFDSHLSHYMPREAVAVCIVTKCDLKVLKQRMEQRGYSKFKTRENMDAEIFDVCLVEAMEERDHEILVVDTTHGCDMKKIAGDVLAIIEKKR